MAQTEIITIKVNAQAAQKQLDDLTVTIQEQKQITVEFQEELVELEKKLKNASGFTERTKIKKQIDNIKDSLKDQRVSLKKLNLERQNAKLLVGKSTKGVTEQTRAFLRNYDIQSGLSQITGGYSQKIANLGRMLFATTAVTGGLTKGMKLLRLAIASTGIGLIVIAAAALVTNFEKLKAVVSGVGKNFKDNLKSSKKVVEELLEELELISEKDKILKLQGKTEREIRDLKIQQTNETITAIEAQLTAQKQLKDEQIKIADRNATILSGILKFLTAPIRLILETIDQAAKFLGKDLGIRGLVDEQLEGVGNIVFDPKKITKDGDKATEELEKQLLRLKNARAGLILTNQEEEDDDEIKKAKELADLKEQIAEASANKEEEIRQRTLQQIKDNNAKLIQEAKDNGLLTEELETSLNERLQAKKDEFAMQDKARADKKTEDDKKRAEEEKRLEEERIARREKTFDHAVKLAGAESKLGKMLLLAKQLLLAKEFIIGAKAAIFDAKMAASKAKVKAAEAGVEVTGSVAKAANTAPPPFNIPFILTAIATGASIISAVKSAVSATKSAASAAGAGGGAAATASAPAITAAQAPAFNIVGTSSTNQLAETIAGQQQQPVKAFVVANDVTTAQSLERNTIQGATI